MATRKALKDDSSLLQAATSLISPSLRAGERCLMAVAGPPAVGKSAFAAELVAALNVSHPNVAALLPMDGFHLDNGVLKEIGLLDRKGSPETFDFAGFQDLLRRVKDDSKVHYVPTFDRARDIAIAAAHSISPETKVIVVEGNYLLLDQDPWRDLQPEFDYSIFIETSLAELRRRLIKRWMDNGYDATGAEARAFHNDIPNAERVLEKRLAADVLFQQPS